MSKWSTLRMIGEMAKGGGTYFGAVHAEARRNERLAQARAEKVADRDDARQYAEKTHQERLSEEAARRQVVRGEKLEDTEAVLALKTAHAAPDNPDLVKGGDGFFYAKTPTGLQRTDVRHTAEGGTSGDKTATERTLEMRMKSAAEALTEMETLEARGYDPTGFGGLKDQWTAGAGVTNWAASSEGQQYQTAAKRVKEAFLRTATGAAAPESENSAYVGMFIPSFGDTAETKEAKKRAIREQIAAMAEASSTGVPQDVADALWRESAQGIARRHGLSDPSRSPAESTGALADQSVDRYLEQILVKPEGSW